MCPRRAWSTAQAFDLLGSFARSAYQFRRREKRRLNPEPPQPLLRSLGSPYAWPKVQPCEELKVKPGPVRRRTQCDLGRPGLAGLTKLYSFCIALHDHSQHLQWKPNLKKFWILTAGLKRREDCSRRVHVQRCGPFASILRC